MRRNRALKIVPGGVLSCVTHGMRDQKTGDGNKKKKAGETATPWQVTAQVLARILQPYNSVTWW